MLDERRRNGMSVLSDFSIFPMNRFLPTCGKFFVITAFVVIYAVYWFLARKIARLKSGIFM